MKNKELTTPNPPDQQTVLTDNKEMEAFPSCSCQIDFGNACKVPVSDDDSKKN